MSAKGVMGTGNTSNPNNNHGAAPRAPPRPFYKDLPEEKPRAPTFMRVTSADAIAQLKASAGGWDAELEGLLGLPRELFRANGTTMIAFRSKAGASLPPFFSHELGDGNVRLGRAEYCITIQERAESGYFLLVDIARRIIVYAEIYSLTNDRGPGWGDVKSAIRSALDLAGSKDAKENGLFAVYYMGSTRLAKQETIH